MGSIKTQYVGGGQISVNPMHVVSWEYSEEGVFVRLSSSNAMHQLSMPYNEFDAAMSKWLTPTVSTITNSCGCK